jgi:predicted ATPase/DNA-binding CsgD family transcriptional regulator
VSVLDCLTPREREIAALVARGYSNRQIAEELVIAGGTAERHIANILAKLNARSRTEIAAHAVEYRLNKAQSGARPEAASLSPDEGPRVGHPLTNLPAEVSSFIGRERELSELAGLLSTSRLLTLTGSGGIGKTRLAVEIARIWADDATHVVAFVELASVNDAELVFRTVAAVLGVREQVDRPLTDTLTEHLSARKALLVLDNCEHLVRTCAELAYLLLRACSRLRILATSRERLGMPGETVWRVPSLSLDRQSMPAAVQPNLQSEAVRLFVERAAASLTGFVVTAQNAKPIADVCRAVEGIPLAIELAASRVSVVGLEVLAAHLNDELRLLTANNRSGPKRQRTLRAAIDWSYHLLSTPEQILFDRLAAFTGGWTLEAAEAICARRELHPVDVPDLLSRLVDQSMVVTDTTLDGLSVRYRLLEPLRQYALERLTKRGGRAALGERHARYYLALARKLSLNRLLVHSDDEAKRMARLEREHENLRTALSWLTQGQLEQALNLAAALAWFWEARGYVGEGRDRLAQLLGMPGEHDPRVRVEALLGAAGLAWAHGDYVAQEHLGAQSLTIARARSRPRHAVKVRWRSLPR